MFLSIPIVIFVVMMIVSGGFSPMTGEEEQTALTPSLPMLPMDNSTRQNVTLASQATSTPKQPSVQNVTSPT